MQSLTSVLLPTMPEHDRTLIFGTLGALMTLCSAFASAGEQLLDTQNLVGDFAPQSSGLEVVVPYQRVTTDGNGIPLSNSTRFDVYTLGSSSRLYSSTAKSFSFSLPWWVLNYCTIDDFDEPQPGDLIARSGSRLVWASGLSLSCWDGATQWSHDRVWIFGADVGTASGASWRFEVNGKLQGGHGRDTNGDGRADQLLIAYSTQSGNSADVTYTVLNFSTGSVVSSNTYPTLR